jgi:RNA polymerase-associated protein LEO1
LRWSDGSLTLQLASDPTVQYEITPKALAPQQRNAPKPTPVSINDGKRGPEKWSEKSESWTYLASASNASFMIRITNKLTASLQVMPSNDGAADEALERLQISMAASRAREGHIKKMDAVAEDPELAKKKAEQADRERTRAIRRLEAQAIREKERATRGFGSGRGGRGAGLTVGGLEDDDTGVRGGARAPRPKQRRKPRNDEYSDDEEEYYGRRRGREDDYDEEDDFIAASDEEEDRDAEGSEEDLDAIIESRTKEQDKAARAGTPKRDRPRDADADAEHDSPVSRQKRRRVVEEDDDDE